MSLPVATFFSLNYASYLTFADLWPRGLRRGSTAARLLGLWVRIPPGAWMSVCVECSVLSDRGLCDGLITRPETSYRLWCVVVCDLATSRMRRPWPALGRSVTGRRRRRRRFNLHLNLLHLKSISYCIQSEILWSAFQIRKTNGNITREVFVMLCYVKLCYEPCVVISSTNYKILVDIFL
jgi:hypothetical protein